MAYWREAESSKKVEPGNNQLDLLTRQDKETPKSPYDLQPSTMSEDLGKSRHGIPDVVMVQIDKYVDSLAPEIQPRITTEIDEFQTKTIDSLEDLVVDSFRSLFDDKGPSGSNSRSLGDAPPDAYGIGSLPFANEIVSLSQSFSKVADGATDDIREIFNLTESGGNEHDGSRGGGGGDKDRGGGDLFSQGARGFLSAAVGAIKDHSNSQSGGGGGEKIRLDGFLGILSDAIKDTSRDPDGKARMISPEIKDKLSIVLREQHAPLAEQFTRIALEKIKQWLRGNTTTRDLGDGVKGELKDEIQGLVKGVAGLFGKKSQSDERSRDGPGGPEDSGTGGFSGMISKKLSTGLAKVHREVRIEFRKILGIIEKNLWEALPDQVQGPLEKILGGNPFDSSLDSQTSSSRGFGDDIKAKLVKKIRDLVRKVQDSLRQSVLAVVNGGHRKFERASWVFVQENVEVRVRKYLPDVRIQVPDDIGNEGVSVGTPQTPPTMQGGGNGSNPNWQGTQQHQSSQDSYYGAPPPPQSSGGSYSQQPPYNQQPHQDQQYRPHDNNDQYQQATGQYQRPNDNYQSQNPRY